MYNKLKSNDLDRFNKLIDVISKHSPIMKTHIQRKIGCDYKAFSRSFNKAIKLGLIEIRRKRYRKGFKKDKNMYVFMTEKFSSDYLNMGKVECYGTV